MQRRNFLKNILPMAAVPFFSNTLVANVLSPDEISPEAMAMIAGDIDRVLILVRLHGGNDGLATVVPMDQYGKLTDPKVRKNLMVSESKLLKINGGAQGLHPTMDGMKGLFDDGKLTIVQGVANSTGVTSHFHGIDQWDSASDKNHTYSSGWMGRYIEQTYQNAPFAYPNYCQPDPFAIELGRAPSLNMRGQGGTLGQSVSAGFNGKFTSLLEVYDDGDLSNNMKRELAFLRSQQGLTNDYGKKIVKAWDSGNNSTIVYPASAVPPTNGIIEQTTLSQQLKIVARLIKGGLKTRIFVVNIGNFDTHQFQGTEAGVHAWLLKDLSGAITAFQKDIEKLGIADKIIGMTYSEFGRRVVENGYASTEHGYGAPMFVFGSKVSGKVIGNNYVVPDLSLVNAGTVVDMQYDYRQVYMSVLQNWMSLAPNTAKNIVAPADPNVTMNQVANIFKNNTAITPLIDMPLVNPNVAPCNQKVSVKEITGDDHDLYARIQPNPTSGAFSIVPSHGFDFGMPVIITVSDLNGRQLHRQTNQIADNEPIMIDLQLASGMYIVSIQNQKYRLNQKVMIQN
jgi:uncharacterized protein (DUF1501 family)